MTTTKEKIFEAAVELFSHQGYNGASIREIARIVGIKESSIYNHYQSKDKILETIFDYYSSEMDKTSISEEYLDEKISNIDPEQFWEIGLANFLKRTEDQQLEKISKIILLEMFRDQRARDIALREFFGRQQEIDQMIFEKMQEKGIIKKSYDPQLLALEYTYPMLAMRIEYNILKNWNLNTDKVQRKMSDHIKFISEVTKNDKTILGR